MDYIELLNHLIIIIIIWNHSGVCKSFILHEGYLINRIINVKLQYLKRFNCMQKSDEYSIGLIVLDNNTGNHLSVCKQMRYYGSFRNTLTNKLFSYKLYIYIYRERERERERESVRGGYSWCNKESTGSRTCIKQIKILVAAITFTFRQIYFRKAWNFLSPQLWVNLYHY